MDAHFCPFHRLTFEFDTSKQMEEATMANHVERESSMTWCCERNQLEGSPSIESQSTYLAFPTLRIFWIYFAKRLDL